jgi:hypothetical protein
VAANELAAKRLNGLTARRSAFARSALVSLTMKATRSMRRSVVGTDNETAPDLEQ